MWDPGEVFFNQKKNRKTCKTFPLILLNYDTPIFQRTWTKQGAAMRPPASYRGQSALIILTSG